MYAQYFFLAKHADLDLFLKRKNVVLISWDYVDYRAQPFFGDVRKFQESANKGMILMRVLLDAGLDYSMADMWVRSLINLWLSDSSIWYI